MMPTAVDDTEPDPSSGSAATDASPSSSSPTNNSNTNRGPKWFLLMASSTIVLGSIADDTTRSQRTTKDKFSLAMAGIAMCLGIIASLAFLIPRNKFPEGTTEMLMMVEGVLIVISLICSSIVLLLTQADNFVVMTQDGTMTINMNINVYYFSWMALFSCVSLLTSLIKASRIKINNGVTELMKKNNGRLKKWCILCIFGIIILASASRNYKISYCDNKDDSKYCKRSILSISVGTITVTFTLMALVITLLYSKKDVNAQRTKVMIEAAVSGILAALFIGSVGVITGSGSPGGYVGNLYYFSWLAFLLSVLLAAECIGAYMALVRSS